jgi:integrase
MGTLYKNGQYWVFSYRENGKNIPISMDGLKGDLSKDRQKKLKRKYEIRYEDNKVKHSNLKTKRTLSKVISIFMKMRWNKVKTQSLSVNTVGGDEKRLRYFKNFVLDRLGDVSIEDIDSKVLDDYTDYCRDVLKVNPTTIHNYHKSVQPLIKFCLIKGWIGENPYKKVDIPKPIRRTKEDIPNKEESKVIKKYLVQYVEDYLKSDELFNLINITSYFQIMLGMRIGEVLSMKWKKGRDDVGEKHSFSYVYLNSNLSSITIHFKRKLRVLPIGQKVQITDLLKKIKDETKSKIFVFENNRMTKKDGRNKGRPHKQSTSKPFNNSYCSRPFKRMLRMLEIDDRYSTHSIRHSFVTNLMRLNVSPQKIGNVVGHSSVTMTEIYGHLDTTDMVDVLDLV